MTNVLIISQFFAPRNVVAAIRFTKMVKYLSRTGKYRFWVICLASKDKELYDELLQRDLDDIKEYISVVSIEMDKSLLNAIKRYMCCKKGIVSKIEHTKVKDETNDIYYILQEKFIHCQQKGWLGNVKRIFGGFLIGVNDIYDLGYEYKFVSKAKRVLDQIPLEKIDVMVSTYGDLGAVMLAKKIKHCYPHLGWIVDYRDPVTAASHLKKKILNLVVCKADRMANYVTGATSSCVGSGKCLRKFRMIPNGYDVEDIQDCVSVQNRKLVICYTGSLYYGKSNMKPLFKIVHELSEENKLDKNQISIIYAGEQFHILKKQAKQYELDDILETEGMVSRKKSLQIQKHADILCALTWNNVGNDDILTGKVLEYFMMQKPILALVSGNKSGSMIKRVIEEARIGYCLEEAGDDKYYNETKEWFLNKYNEFKEKGRIACNPRERILEKYSCEKMADKFGMLIERC